MAQLHTFDPQISLRPDHLEIKLNFLIDSVYSLLRYGQPFEVAFAQHELDFVLVGRGVSAIFGVGCIFMAFLIVRRVNVVAGLISAALVATFVPLVVNAHFATPETPQAFFTLLLIWFAMIYLEKGRLWAVLLAAASIGVAYSVKYPAIITVVMIAIVVSVVAARRRSWQVFLGHGTASIAAVIAGAFLISPMLVLDPGRVVVEIQGQNNPVHTGADGLNWFGNAGFYLSDFLGSAGVLLAIASLGGAVWVLRRRPLETIPLWTGALYWLVLSVLSLHWSRWGVPMYLSPLLMAGIGIQVFLAWVWGQRFKGRRGWVVALRLVALSAVALLGVNQLVWAVAEVSELAAKDTRVVGLEVEKAHGVTAVNSIAEGYTPRMPGKMSTVFHRFAISDDRLRLVEQDPEIKFLITSSFMRSRFLVEPKYSAEQRFYAGVDSELRVVASIEPVVHQMSIWEPQNIFLKARSSLEYWSGGLTGPTLRYYDVSSLPRG